MTGELIIGVLLITGALLYIGAGTLTIGELMIGALFMTGALLIIGAL